MELHSRRGRILLWLRLRRRGWLCGGCRLKHSRFRASVNLGCMRSLRLLTVFGFAFFAAGSVAAAPSAALHTPQTVQTYAAAQRKQQALDAPRSRRGSCTASRIGRTTRSPTASRVRRSPPAPARSRRRPRSRSAPGTAAACGRRSTRCTSARRTRCSSCVHAFSGQTSEPVGFAPDTTVLPYLLARLSRPGRPQGKPQAWSPQAWPPQPWPPQPWPRPARPLWQPLPVSPAPSSLAPSSSSQQTQLCAQAGSLSIEASRSGSCIASHGELAGVVGVLAAAGTAAGMLWAFRSAGEAVGVAWPMAEG